MDFRWSIAGFLGVVALFGAAFSIVGRRGYGESQTVHSLSIARSLGGARWDVTQWLSAFATSSGEYTLTHAAPANFYATSSSDDAARGQIFNGKDGKFLADIPLFSSRVFTHRGVMQGDDLGVEVEKWESDGKSHLSALRIKPGPGFPKKRFRCRRCAATGFFTLALRKAAWELADGGTPLAEAFSREKLQPLTYNYRYNNDNSTPEAGLRAMLPLLQARALGVGEMSQQVSERQLPPDQAPAADRRARTARLSHAGPRLRPRERRGALRAGHLPAMSGRFAVSPTAHHLRPLPSAILHCAFVAKPPKASFRMTACFCKMSPHGHRNRHRHPQSLAPLQDAPGAERRELHRAAAVHPRLRRTERRGQDDDAENPRDAAQAAGGQPRGRACLRPGHRARAQQRAPPHRLHAGSLLDVPADDASSSISISSARPTGSGRRSATRSSATCSRSRTWPGGKDDLISGLSRGMQQRVSLARVLVHDPDLAAARRTGERARSAGAHRAHGDPRGAAAAREKPSSSAPTSSANSRRFATMSPSSTAATVKYTGTMRGLIANARRRERDLPPHARRRASSRRAMRWRGCPACSASRRRCRMRRATR